MNTVVHVTHEAVVKIGGIGAVLEGLLTSRHYQQQVGRTILVQPLFTTAGGVDDRLGAEGQVLYSSLDGRTSHQYGPAFDRIKYEFNVEIVYGHRTLHHPGSMNTDVEVLLIDVNRMDIRQVNRVKGRLWDLYQLQSDRYEYAWDFDEWVKLSGPALACLHAIGAPAYVRKAGSPPPPPTVALAPAGPGVLNGPSCIIVAHEFMGIPTALLAAADPDHDYRTVFYAHEVATMRRLVEDNPGHDTMFYNVLSKAIEQGLFVEDVFGDQHGYFKHPLVARARLLDNCLAVGDYVIKELRFMGRNWEQVPVDLSYNGIPARAIPLADKLASRERLRQYCENLLGYRPDYLFTHVSRMALSKALWRDFDVLQHLDAEFGKRGQTGVLLVLSCGAAPRRPADVAAMEQEYHWPVCHREGMPDLSPPEADYYVHMQHFNARSRNVKAVFINQFDFSRELAGIAVPEGTHLEDLHIGTDVEFGQSIYEPFGIAMLEPLTYGGLCVISSVCGCKGFVDDVTGGEGSPNVLVADYTDLAGTAEQELDSLRKIGRLVREATERQVSRQVAAQLMERLPADDAARERLLKSGYKLARKMSWDEVAKDYFLPALDRACRHGKERANPKRMVAG